MTPSELDTYSMLVKVLVVEDRQIIFVVHQKFVCDPVYNLSKVSADLDVAVRRIPEDWYKALSSALLSLKVVTKLDDIILDIIQFQVSRSYDLALLG